jgi:hypothetical protein
MFIIIERILSSLESQFAFTEACDAMCIVASNSSTIFYLPSSYASANPLHFCFLVGLKKCTDGISYDD